MGSKGAIARGLVRRPVLASAGVFAAICATFVGVFAVAQRLEEARTATEYGAASMARLRAVSYSIDADLRLLRFMRTDFRALLATRERALPGFLGVVNAELRAFAGDLLEGERDLWLAACALRVPSDTRASFEAQARSDVDAEFRIVELSADGELVPADSEGERFPVVAILPASQAAGLLGIDMMSVPGIREALEKARDTAEIAASTPVALRGAGEPSVWLAGALYRTASPPATTEQRRTDLAGYMLMGLRPDMLFGEALAGLYPASIDLLIEDVTIQGDRLVIAVHSSRSRTTPVGADEITQQAARSRLAESKEIRFADRNWRVLTSPAPSFFAMRLEWQAWAILGVGILLASLVSVSLHLSVVRRRRIEEMVAERTAELTREIQEKERIEAQLKDADRVLTERIDDLGRRTTEIGVLNSMGEMLQRCMTTAEALPVIARFGGRLFPRDAGTLCLYDEGAQFMERAAGWGESPGGDALFAPDRCWALRSGKPHVVEDPARDLVCHHVGALPPGTGTLCVPLMAQGQVLGLLNFAGPVDPSVEPEAADSATARRGLAITVADQISLALANIRLREILREQSIRDPLTGLYNRRFMEEIIQQTLHRAQRAGGSVGVIMIDIDHFKRFNDGYGHDAGDALLRSLGAFLRGALRESDTACRYGGEEFAVIMPEASVEIAAQRAEKLREGVKELRVSAGATTLGSVTLSLGVAAFPAHGTDRDGVLGAADRALYRAKAEGRDRVVVA